MHGGNAGMVGLPLERGREEESSKERRLDDFWQMTLLRSAPGYLLVAQLLSLFYRPGSEEVMRRATYQLRRQQLVSISVRFPLLL